MRIDYLIVVRNGFCANNLVITATRPPPIWAFIVLNDNRLPFVLFRCKYKVVINEGKSYNRVASRMRFPRDRALIRLQTRIFLESAVTKLYENA